MSERDDRTVEPSSRRIEQARSEGRVAISRPLVSGVMLVSGIALLVFAGHAGGSRLLDGVHAALREAFEAGPIDADRVTRIMRGLGELGMRVLAPFGVALWIAALLAGLVQSRAYAGIDLVVPRLDRLSVLAAGRRILSWRTWTRGGLIVLEWSLIAYAAYRVVAFVVVSGAALDPAAVFESSFSATLAGAGRELFRALAWVSFVVLSLAAIDWVFVRRQYLGELRMTPAEAAAEAAMDAPSPYIRQRRAEFARRLRQRSREEGRS